MDAQIPQTAKVARGAVDIEVTYDGEPIYEPVDGTDLVYIQNTVPAIDTQQHMPGHATPPARQITWPRAAAVNGMMPDLTRAAATG
jgi:hypothetical protein